MSARRNGGPLTTPHLPGAICLETTQWWGALIISTIKKCGDPTPTQDRLDSTCYKLFPRRDGWKRTGDLEAFWGDNMIHLRGRVPRAIIRAVVAGCPPLSGDDRALSPLIADRRVVLAGGPREDVRGARVPSP